MYPFGSQESNGHKPMEKIAFVFVSCIRFKFYEPTFCKQSFITINSNLYINCVFLIYYVIHNH